MLNGGWEGDWVMTYHRSWWAAVERLRVTVAFVMNVLGI